jgi:hypothetical protein
VAATIESLGDRFYSRCDAWYFLGNGSWNFGVGGV